MEVQKVININKFDNDSHKHEQARKICGKIIPRKYTFLNSNQLITKYIKKGNVRQNLLSSTLNSSKSMSAYDLCLLQTIGHQADNHEKKIKQNKILNEIAQNSHLIMKQKAYKERQLNNQAKRIQMMVQSIYGKAGDIMCGRNSSNYKRKQTNKGQIPLKQLKSYTSQKSLRKIQFTRQTMLNRIQNFDGQIPLQIQSSKINNSLSLQFSQNQSLISNSVNSKQIFKETKKAKKENILRDLLKNQGFDKVYQVKRRNAAIKGFGMYWQLGNVDKKLNKVCIFNKYKSQKRNIKKMKSCQYKRSFLEQLNDKNKCQVEIKQIYINAFKERARQFALTQKS